MHEIDDGSTMFSNDENSEKAWDSIKDTDDGIFKWVNDENS